MDTLFLILLPIVISGLGFLTYRHPPIARKILNPLFYISLISFLFIQLSSLTQSSAYYKSINATRINIDRQTTQEINIDSLYKTVKDKDSIDNIMLDSKYQREKSYAIFKSQSEIKDSIRNQIDILLSKSRDTNNNYLLYCFAGFLIIIILQALSFLFDTIHNKEKVSDINNSNDHAE